MLHLPSIARSQNTEETSIKIYYLMATTPWDISIDAFDSFFLDSKYCKHAIIENLSEVSLFISELSNITDTIISGNNNYCEKTDTVKKLGKSALVYPEMDTRGKMIIITPKGNKVFYYSLNYIWDSTDNRLYKMNEKLRAMIIHQFFPKESMKQGTTHPRGKRKNHGSNDHF